MHRILLPALALGLLLCALPLPSDGGLGLHQAALADNDDDDEGHKKKRHRHHHDDDDDDDDDDDRGRQRGGGPPAPQAPPELVVALADPGDAAAVAAAGFTILEQQELTLLGGALLRVAGPAGMTLEQARALVLTASPGALLDLNSLYRPEEFTCAGARCGAFDLIAWSAPEGGCPLSPVIGMLDTTVNAEHPGLAGQALERITLLGKDREPASAVHGTAVAALLIGQAGSRTPGLLPQARLLAVEVFHSDSRGQATADAFDLLRGLDLLAERGVPLINMSFAGPPNALLEAAVARLAASGVGLVAAAGNGGPNAEPLYPGAYDGVLAVTAVAADLSLFRQAAAGPHIDFAAPGVRLWTAASVSGGRQRSGTSFAVPFVTAALAIEQMSGSAAPLEEQIAALAARARDLGEPGRDPRFGWGLVQSLPCAPKG